VRAQACVMRAYIRVRAQDDVRVKIFLVFGSGTLTDYFD
jgi:hypothetical protein